MKRLDSCDLAPLPLIPPPLQHSNFKLDIFSIAGFFGGDEVIESLRTLHFYRGRRFRGWYNTPGAYTVAKSLGRIANTRFWRGLFPGSRQDPVSSFGLDGKKGPQFLAALSGTEMTTGYMGYLLAEDIKEMDKIDLGGVGLRSRRMGVAIVDIKEVKKVTAISTPSPMMHLLLSYFTMITSVSCAIFSLILFNDRFCFAAITLGILINGISTMVIGIGDFSLNTVFIPGPGAPPGDGVLLGDDFIVLRGYAHYVNAITENEFALKMIGHPTSQNPSPNPPYHAIGICSSLYFLQFIIQLFLVPQGNLPGQIMYLVSFSVPWLNNGMITAIDKEALEMRILRASVVMKIRKYVLTSRTGAAVFTCMALSRSADEIAESPVYAGFDLKLLLKHMLPSDTRVWRKWRNVVCDVLQFKKEPEYLDEALGDPDCSDLREDERQRLATLLRGIYENYHTYAD